MNMPEVPPELGGILGCVNGIICDVFFDNQYLTMSSAIYKPNIVTLNKKYRRKCDSYDEVIQNIIRNAHACCW